MTTNPIAITDPHAGVLGHASEDPELVRQCAASGQMSAAQMVGHRMQAPAAATPPTRADLLAIFTEWARQVSERADVPQGVRYAAAQLHKQGAMAADGVATAPAPKPLNGIAATMWHDEGARAQCGDCGRYTLNPEALTVATHRCECGSRTGWSGSFKRPGPNAKWSGAAPGVKGLDDGR